MKRNAKAVWLGSGMEGHGKLTTDSTVLNDTQYSFSTRFADGIGTNPEELIGAAHAGCFSMALAFQLNGAGFEVESLETKATIHMEKFDTGWKVTKSELFLNAKVPGIDVEKFTELTQKAKVGCPISQLLNAEIVLHATLD